jgi:hypothetical protein
MICAALSCSAGLPQGCPRYWPSVMSGSAKNGPPAGVSGARQDLGHGQRCLLGQVNVGAVLEKTAKLAGKVLLGALGPAEEGSPGGLHADHRLCREHDPLAVGPFDGRAEPSRCAGQVGRRRCTLPGPDVAVLAAGRSGRLQAVVVDSARSPGGQSGSSRGSRVKLASPVSGRAAGQDAYGRAA